MTTMPTVTLKGLLATGGMCRRRGGGFAFPAGWLVVTPQEGRRATEATGRSQACLRSEHLVVESFGVKVSAIGGIPRYGVILGGVCRYSLVYNRPYSERLCT